MGAIFVVAASFALFYTTKISEFQNDDLVYSRLAIALSESIGPLLDPTGEGFGRFNQLYTLTLAPMYGAFSNPVAFQIAHIWNALLMASAVVPVYLLARDLVHTRAAAYLAAVLVGICPWMTLSTGMLTEIAGFPAFAWALLAINRALAAPSLRRDLVALVAIAVAAFARLQLIVLVVVLPAAALLHEVGWAVASRGSLSRWQALRAGTLAFFRRHRLLGAALVVVLVGVLVLRASSSTALGFYSNTIEGNLLPAGSLGMARGHLAYIVLGLGIAPAILAFAWTGANLIRPEGKRAHAFASLLAVAVPTLALQVGSITQRFDPGFIQERYLFYVVPLLVVGMAAGLGARRLVAATLAAGALVALLVLRVPYESSLSSFWFFDSPGLAFYLKVVANALHDVAGWLGASDWTPVELGAAAAVLVTAVLALLAARARADVRLAVVGVCLVTFSVVATRYDFQQVVYGSLGGKGFGAQEVDGRDWVDRHVPDGADVAILAAQQGDTATSRLLWWHAEFWNRSLRRGYVLGSGPTYVWNAPQRRRLDFETGLLRVADPQPYIVVAARHSPIQLKGRRVARSPDGRLLLLRTSVPYTAAMAVQGASDDGWLAMDRPARIRVYGLRPGRCERLAVTLAAGTPTQARRAFRVRAGGRTHRGVVRAGLSQSVRVRACAPRAGAARHADVLVSQGRSADPADVVGLQLADVRLLSRSEA